jgi:DNA-binding transcriptional ArsR family regulator
MTTWTFLSNHGRALLCIARDPEIRLRDIATDLGITERRAYDIVRDLAEAEYVIKERDGRRNRYQVQEHLPLPEDPQQERALGEVLRVLTAKRAPARTSLG